MARSPQEIAESLKDLLQPAARHRLLARGLARGMVWREGRLPEGSAPYSEDLSEDLLEYGYVLMAMGLELRDANRPVEGEPVNAYETQEAFRVAAEAIESCVRRGDPGNPARGLHLVVSAAAFHLAGYAARSFTLLNGELSLNLSSMETAVSLLLQRSLVDLRAHVLSWLADDEHSDEGVVALIEAGDWDLGRLTYIGLARPFLLAIGEADTALYMGDERNYWAARSQLLQVADSANEIGNVPAWWTATLARHLLDDLWDQSLHKRLPQDPPDSGTWPELRRSFIEFLCARKPPQIDLWPSQLEAARRASDPTDSLVVSLPTSAGKTRIAELCLLRAYSGGKRTVYVTPLRALSAQVEQTLSRTFVPLGAKVTSLYGAAGVTPSDAHSLASADVVVATPEKLDFAIRQDPAVLDSVGLVVFDEGHMIGLGSREIRYEVLIQRLLRREDAGERRIVCLSAMFTAEDPSFGDFHDWLCQDRGSGPIHVEWRPTRQAVAFLDWYAGSGHGRLQILEGEEPFVPRFIESKPGKKRRQNPVPSDDKELCAVAALAFAEDGNSVLIYSPQRTMVEPVVKAFVTLGRQEYLDSLPRPSQEVLEKALAIGREWLGEQHPAVKGLPLGVGTHHAALPRPFQAEIERLLAAKELSVVVASPTLAQGMDLSCSVLLFRAISRFEPRLKGHKTIPAEEFANVVGRVGRAYVDLDGLAVFPVFDKHRSRHDKFQELLDQSKDQRLWSGLCRLVYRLSELLSRRLGVGVDSLVEFVANNQELWDSQLLTPAHAAAQGEKALQQAEELQEKLADLDVAVLALVDPLSAPESEIAALLDNALQGSLLARTLIRTPEVVQDRINGVLRSRAAWLWRNTSPSQRSACFAAGLGQASGVFIYERLDELVNDLAELHHAIAEKRGDDLADPALRFAETVMEDWFFNRNPPLTWREGLEKWIAGIEFAEILKIDSKLQAFVQDGVVFKLVWAAEAVRVQAATTEHPRAAELGEGPALVFTHGVPSVQAALLCQAGLASRTAAVHATTQLGADFTDFNELWRWVNENEDRLFEREFWDSDDQFLLWRSLDSKVQVERARNWERRTLTAEPTWAGAPPPVGTRVRVIATSRHAQIASESLEPLGAVEFPDDISEAHLIAHVVEDGALKVLCFGPRSGT